MAWPAFAADWSGHAAMGIGAVRCAGGPQAWGAAADAGASFARRGASSAPSGGAAARRITVFVCVLGCRGSRPAQRSVSRKLRRYFSCGSPGLCAAAPEDVVSAPSPVSRKLEFPPEEGKLHV